MICDTVDELTPIIGTRPACRAAGHLASHGVPPSPPARATAAEAVADAR
jgi:hypothetical protein